MRHGQLCTVPHWAQVVDLGHMQILPWCRWNCTIVVQVSTMFSQSGAVLLVRRIHGAKQMTVRMRTTVPACWIEGTAASMLRWLSGHWLLRLIRQCDICTCHWLDPCGCYFLFSMK